MGQDQSSNGLSKPLAILKLRPSGLGDMLAQIDRFLCACDHQQYEGKVHVGDVNKRNELPTPQLLALFNITNDNLLVDQFIEEGSQSAATFFAEKRVTPASSSKPLYLKFDNSCYLVRASYQSEQTELGIHPTVIDIIRSSEIFERVRLQKAKHSRKRICVHVRRGDVAQIPVSTIRHLVKSEIGSDMMLHLLGVMELEELESRVAPSIRDRYRRMKWYGKVLDKQLALIGDDAEIVLVSDGMTKLATRLKNKHNDIFINAEISREEIERALEEEMSPLIQRCSRSLLGEGNTMEQCIIEAASSDVLISKSPGFLRFISQASGAKVVSPK